MKTFFNILQTIVGKTHKTYHDEPFTENPHYFNVVNEIYKVERGYIDYLIWLIFVNEQQNPNNMANKFTALNRILGNVFFKGELKDTIRHIFCLAQKYYYAFIRLARHYRVKKAQLIVQNDLSLNPLDPSHRNTFTLIENKSKYYFGLNDLITIIETAIGNAPEFFADTQWPLNPYNNQPFTKSTLYGIYFQMKNANRLISPLFHFFFLENFCLKTFTDNYEHFIRENSIKKFVFNSPYTVLHSDVLTMIRANTYTKLWHIHKEFPKEKLVEIFRPFLYCYYIYNYDIQGTNKVYNSETILYNKLKKLYEHNKLFGRRFIKLTTNNKNKIIKKDIEFNSQHIPFHKIDVNLDTDMEISGNIQYNFTAPPTTTVGYIFHDNYSSSESDDSDNDESNDFEEVDSVS
jgi:hypothetical protein